MKQSDAYKGYNSTYNVEDLNYFNPEFQLKDTKSGITNKLKDLLIKLNGFQFVTLLF